MHARQMEIYELMHADAGFPEIRVSPHDAREQGERALHCGEGLAGGSSSVHRAFYLMNAAKRSSTLGGLRLFGNNPFGLGVAELD